MSTLIITHTDGDGLGVIVLARHFQNKGIYLYDEIYSKDYDFEDDEKFFSYSMEFDRIIIADLTLKKEKVQQWINHGIEVIIYDHHAETEWITEFEGSVWDTARCGTKIFWQEYVKPKIGRYKPIVDEYVELVNTYDLWKKDDDLWDDAKDLVNVMYGMFDYGAPSEEEKRLPYYLLMSKKFDKLSNWRWTQKEVSIIERAHKREQEMYEKAMSHISFREDLKGKMFGVIMIPSKISLVASRILEEHDFLDYLIVLNTYGGLSGKLSFRSSRGFYCPSIGVANGHDAAAGGMISPDEAKQFWENEDLSFRYNEDYNENKPQEIFDGITYL